LVFPADLQNTYSQLSLSSAADRLSQIHGLQDELEHHEPSQCDHSDEHHILAAELTRLTQHLRKLESDNTDLSAELVSRCSSYQASEVLREQIRSLEAKVAHTDSLRQQLAQLQVPPPPSTAPDNQALTSLRLETSETTLLTLLKLFNDYKLLSTSHPQYQSLLDRIDQLKQ